MTALFVGYAGLCLGVCLGYALCALWGAPEQDAPPELPQVPR